MRKDLTLISHPTPLASDYLIDTWALTDPRDGDLHVVQVIIHAGFVLDVDEGLVARWRGPHVDSQRQHALVFGDEAPFEDAWECGAEYALGAYRRNQQRLF